MSDRKKILCIVPLPLPITGAATASEIVVNYLKGEHEVTVLAYQRGNLISGGFSLEQFVRIFVIVIRLLFLKKKFDAAYLVISSTFWGNMRDIFFLIVMGKDLRKKTVLHLHGANIDRYLKESPFWIKYLNRKLFREVKNAIVLGNFFNNIFEGYIDNSKIRIVENSFDPALLIPEGKLIQKFTSVEKVKIIFLSNLIKEKGYEILLDAFLALPDFISNKAELHFAGEFYSYEEKNLFLNKIGNHKNIFFHGSVAGKKKQELFWTAHIFCLPSFYRYEGQPISIIEAYASGCFVIITSNGGIIDIFGSGINGLFIDIDIDIDIDVDVFRERLNKQLDMLISDIEKYKDIAHFNFKEASKKYTQDIFCKKISHILIGRQQIL